MKTLLTLILVFGCALAATAQQKYFYVSLDINKPVSNTSWINSTSSAGFKAGYRGFINDKFSAGIDFTSTTLDQYSPTETIQKGNGAITTDYFRYVYSYSATVNGQYNVTVGNGETLFPYVGLGVGANHNEYVMYYNIYQDSERRWGFLVRPEAGLLVKIGKRGSFGAIAGVHYDYSTNKSEKFNYDNFSNIGFNIGIVLMDMY